MKYPKEAMKSLILLRQEAKINMYDNAEIAVVAQLLNLNCAMKVAQETVKTKKGDTYLVHISCKLLNESISTALKSLSLFMSLN